MPLFNGEKTKSLRDYRGEKPAKIDWFRRKASFLFRYDSLFYFGLIAIVTGILWTVYSLAANSFTQMFNWDYAWQYVPFAYDYYDAWHTFFRTGSFPLYDAQVWLGTDRIGSGSYYGLFDPFVFLINFFPRSFIPQAYVISTIIRLTVSCFLMRAYLRYLGIKEWTARVGAIAYSFSGYVTFMAGFASFLTITALLPLMLYGIEKVLKDRNPVALAVGVFLIGVSNFFLLVPCCIFGVFYALWRFFVTVKERNRNANLIAMGLGVAGFAIGLCLCSFSLIPSMRETLLSGRSSSIGSAYWNAIKASIQEHNPAEFFSLVFEEVGDNPGRELMGLISFFFPTGGFTILPLARSEGYDAWTASLFVYTPMIICFFGAMIHSVRLKRWRHFFALAFCVFLVFTNFSYFFFYAFSGNGYGRWFIVLVPIIVYYACWGLDQREEGPRWIPLTGGIIAFASTIASFYVIGALLKGKTFSASVYNPNHQTYWQSKYYVAEEIYNNISTTWYFYYQLGLIILETFLLFIGAKKKWLPKALLGCVVFEAAIMGNITYAFNGTYSVENWWAGGTNNVSISRRICEEINKNEKDFARVYSDTFLGTNYAAFLAGVNGTASFHSLMNFDTEDFSLANQMKHAGSSHPTYGGEQIYNPSWSGYYANKRMGLDALLSYRYYVTQNSFNIKGKDGKKVFFADNIPFGAEEIPLPSGLEDYRLYRESDAFSPRLGYTVNPENTYRLGRVKDSPFKTAFFHSYGGQKAFLELEHLAQTMYEGAIVEDGEVVPEGFAFKEAPADYSWIDYEDAFDGKLYCSPSSSYGAQYHFVADYYETDRFSGTSIIPDSSSEFFDEGPAFFLNHYTAYESNFSWNRKITLGKGKVVLYPKYTDYFNEDDPTGAYFEIRLPVTTDDKSKYHAPALYAIGDRFNEKGEIVEENACLALDYNGPNNARKSGIFDYSSSTFGLYARDGKVKYLVLGYDDNDSSRNFEIAASNIYFQVVNRTVAEKRLQGLSGHFKNLQTKVNQYEFDLLPGKQRIFVTGLGYDKGWSARAVINGSATPLQSLKVNGGLYGFIAPASEGDTHIVMAYETPYSKLSTALWIVGASGIAAYLGLAFYFQNKKKKPSLDLTQSAKA